MEQLVLHGSWLPLTKLCPGNHFANHHWRRRWALPKEQQPCQNCGDRWIRLAEHRVHGDAPTQGTQNVAAGVLATQLNFFRFKKTNLNVTGILLPAVSEPGRVHFDTNASYYIKLFSDLSWNATFYGNFDNRPPRALSGSDYGSSSGLSWTFGNR